MFGTEQKVGLFIVATLVLLGLGTFLIGDMQPIGAPERQHFTATFSDVQGLKEQAPVRMAGVEIGEVGEIRLANGKAKVELLLRPDVRLPKGTRALIGGSGLVGDKYVILTYPEEERDESGPGKEGKGKEGARSGNGMTTVAQSGERGREYLPEGADIPEESRARDLDDLMRTFGAVGEDVKEVTETLRNVFGNDEGEQKLQGILDNVNQLAADLRGMAAENREDIRKVVANVRGITKTLKQDLPPMVADFRSTAKNANRILENNREDLRKLVAKLSESADNLAEITGNIRQGEGTIGKLYKEDKVYADLSEISGNLEEITTKINEGEGALGKLVSDKEVGRQLESAVAGLGEYSQRVQRLQTSISLDTRYLTEQETSKSDFNVRLQTRPTRYYLAGVTSDGLAADADDAEPGDPLFGQKKEFGSDFKFTFMFGKTWPEYGLSGRIGLFQSTGGLGMSYYPARSLELSADFWDFGGDNSGTEFEGPQSRFMARYAFLDDHLLLEGGIHNAFSEEYRSPFIGLGLRFFDEDLKYLAGSVPTGGL
ncbi:MlaD family protein [Thiohalorhabdus sp. Cl-TMA]|uniref:MlaD family protein n=1 Tax=Thiohalorhabdus methylotrophus TaxID=3242694 RepID=A0ABV4TYE1_9GAMM